MADNYTQAVIALVLAIALVLLICILLLRDANGLRHARVLADIDPRPSETSPDATSLVSVIVPVRNEQANLARCMDGLVSQEYPRYEIIVIDDGSIDLTPGILTAAVACAGCAVCTRCRSGMPC